jgi:hypothetical protein
VKEFNPKARRKRGLNKESTKNIIDRAKRSFGLPVLRRSIRTRKTKKYAMRKKEVAVWSVFKFTAIVTLNKTNRNTKMRKYVLAQISKNSVYIRLGTKRECPDIMRIIIQKY